MENDTVKLENGLKMGQRKHLWYESEQVFNRKAISALTKKCIFTYGLSFSFALCNRYLICPHLSHCGIIRFCSISRVLHVKTHLKEKSLLVLYPSLLPSMLLNTSFSPRYNLALGV